MGEGSYRTTSEWTEGENERWHRVCCPHLHSDDTSCFMYSAEFMQTPFKAHIAGKIFVRKNYIYPCMKIPYQLLMQDLKMFYKTRGHKFRKKSDGFLDSSQKPKSELSLRCIVFLWLKWTALPLVTSLPVLVVFGCRSKTLSQKRLQKP